MTAASAAAIAITVMSPPPSLARIGELVTVRGRLRHALPGARSWLQIRRAARWRTVAASSPDRTLHFVLRWRPAKGSAVGAASWRVAVARRGHVLGATGARQFAIGLERVPCATPVPPAVMITSGEGWIFGGLYLVGGPYPGIDACSSPAYTILAKDSLGRVVTTQNVAGGHSYTLVVPTGTYSLQTANGVCHGTATVRAGRPTTADTTCLVP